MPGLTSCLRACSLLYNGKYCGNNGLGPISDMSPLRTLTNCGNSSIDVERTNLPTFVRRASSGNRFPLVSHSSVMVLNLNNRPSFPGRSCRKNAPAPLLAKCSQTATMSRKGHITSNAHNAKMKSITRLKKCLYIAKLF